MATAPNSLSSELECAICTDQLEQPKFIGPCNHTFCKNCIDQLWASRGGMRTVPCPQCRKDCPIPSNGLDGLKDNFMVANIIETYCNQQQMTATEVKCIRCPNGASTFCKECDVKLCPKCKFEHDCEPGTSAHDHFGLCPTHGNGLLFFCSPCKQAVCSGCRISDHDQGDHHVIPSRPIVVDLMSDILASSVELEDAMKIQFGERKRKLLQLRDIIQGESTSAEVQETANVERIIVDKRSDIENLRAESQNLQEQIDMIVKKKEQVDDMTKQLVNDVDQLKKEKAKIIAAVRERFAKSYEDIDPRLRSLDTYRREVTAKLEQGRAVASTKINIDTESIANLTSLSRELVVLVRTSRENDTRTAINEVRELGLDIGDVGQGLAVITGDHQTCQKRVFRRLKKVCNVLTFPIDQCCETVHRLKHLLVSDSRIVTLGTHRKHLTRQTRPLLHGDRLKHLLVSDSCIVTLGTHRKRWTHQTRLHLHGEGHSALSRTITAGVDGACDMAVSSTGEVVVARGEKPPIRVFNLATGAFRDINITHDGKVIDHELRYVETDESDNMFVLIKYSDYDILLVVRPNGSVIQSVLQLHGKANNYMAFCLMKKILYIAANDRIQRFHWSNNIIKEISPSSHGVEGFICYDVSIGSGGEVLVVGRMENMDIVIYQVTDAGEDEEDLVWREIKYQDGVKRSSSGSDPRICISDDNLWLGYKDQIEKFKLV